MIPKGLYLNVQVCGLLEWRRFSVLVLVACVACTTPIFADTEEAINSYRKSLENKRPMDTEGLDAGLARILNQYYDRNFGSAENWEAIESLRFEGLIHFPNGTARFTGYKKKPDLYKVTIFMGGGNYVTMAYDGSDAWQLDTTQADAAPRSMAPKEARNFIRDAPIGGHLLYPTIEGKELKLVGIEDIDGNSCFQIEVTLPDGQKIVSYLDKSSFAELRETTVNATNGQLEHASFSDFIRVKGIRLPFESTLVVEGEGRHRIEITNAKANAGLLTSMFERPSWNYSTNALPEEEKSDLMEPTDTLMPFGEEESLFTTEPQTAFPSLEEEGNSVFTK